MAMPTLLQLQAFLAVAEHAGFSAAADELGTSQPAVSQQVRLLEHTLGLQLFERHARGTVVTAAGEALLPFAQAAATAVDALSVEAERQRTGLRRLRIAAIPTIAPYLLPKAIVHLREERPGIQLLVSEMRTAEIVESLSAGQLDLALIATDEDSDAIVSLPVMDDPFLLAVGTTDAMAARRRVTPQELARRDVLLLQDGHCLRGQAQAVCASVGQHGTHDVRASSLTTVCQMVAAGQGVTLLPRMAVEVECRAGSGVVAIPMTGGFGRTISIAWRRTSSLAPRIEELAHGLRPALRP